MKSKKQKRDEALARAKDYTYANSKAKRTGSATEEVWASAKMIHQLELME